MEYFAANFTVMKWGMGDLKFSEVITAIQNYLYNWETQAYSFPKMKKFLSRNKV